MKKIISLVLAIVMIATLAVSVSAAPSVTEWVNVVSVSEDYVMTRISNTESISAADMAAAIAGAEEGVIPEGANLGRLTIMMQRKITAKVTPFDISLRVWGTSRNTLCLFFKGTEDEAWSLVACNKGEIIEATLPSSGYICVAMAW